jgi:hypothetical protein
MNHTSRMNVLQRQKRKMKKINYKTNKTIYGE